MTLLPLKDGSPDNEGRLGYAALDATGPTSKETIVKVLKTGTYYVKITTDATRTSPYRLMSRATGDTDIATRTKARNMGTLSVATKSVDGSLGGADRNDWYKFTTKRFKRTVTLALQNVGDLNLMLYNAKGRLLKSSATTGDANEEIVRNLNAGTYYVRVVVSNAVDLDETLAYTLDMEAPKVGSTPT